MSFAIVALLLVPSRIYRVLQCHEAVCSCWWSSQATTVHAIHLVEPELESSGHALIVTMSQVYVISRAIRDTLMSKP